MADKKILLVVGIHEGRRFPKRPKCKLIVEAKFDGEILSTDPVDHNDNPAFTTELAWELDKKTLHQHKLQRTPIKLQCFCIDENSEHKESVGYSIIDIRNVAAKPKKLNWYSLLNSKYHKLKPEIRALISLEDDTTQKKPTEERKVPKPILREPGPKDLNVVLNEKEGFYVIGKSLEKDQIYVLSVTIAAAKNLVKVLPSSFEVDVHSGFYFFYTLLGNEVSNDTFNDILNPEFTAERASVRIKADKEVLKLYLTQNPTFEVYFCCKSQALASARVSLLPFVKDLNNVGHEPVTIEGLFPMDRPGSSEDISPIEERAVVGLSLVLRYESNDAAGFPGGSSPIISSGGNPQSAKMKASQKPVTIGGKDQPQLQALGDSKQQENNRNAKSEARLHPSSKRQSSLPARLPSAQESSLAGPHHYSFSIDLRSLNQMDCDHSIRCFCRYTYPFFGSSAPVLTNPAVEVYRNAEVLLPQSFCAFEFATNEKLLKDTLKRIPLIVELWQRDHARRDTLLGTGHLDLSAVYSVQKTQFQDGKFRSVHSCKIPVLDTSSQPKRIAVIQVVLGLEDLGMAKSPHLPVDDNTQSLYSNTLTSELQNVNEVASNQAPPEAAPRETREYQAALELEVWKEHQEEVFMKELQQKELAHMKILADEWKRRDTEREHLVKRKIDEYNALEGKMRQSILDLERREKKVASDEAEVHRVRNQLLMEHESRTSQLTEAAKRLKEDCEHQIAMERSKGKQLEEDNKRVQERLRLAEKRYADKENELISHRAQEQFTPEVKLQAEINLLHLEKTELERKVDSITKSKLHYKQQWGRALRELAKIKQNEQVAAKARLKRQEDELNSMRLQYIAKEEKKVVEQDRFDLQDMRGQLQRLLDQQKPQIPAAQEYIVNNVQLRNGSQSQRPRPGSASLDNRIAKLIEERDTLLQTGVYTNDDRIIMELDHQIRECIARTYPE